MCNKKFKIGLVLGIGCYTNNSAFHETFPVFYTLNIRKYKLHTVLLHILMLLVPGTRVPPPSK